MEDSTVELVGDREEFERKSTVLESPCISVLVIMGVGVHTVIHIR
jgi:hypothetical protein